jgi:hypothetical protein
VLHILENDLVEVDDAFSWRPHGVSRDQGREPRLLETTLLLLLPILLLLVWIGLGGQESLLHRVAVEFDLARRYEGRGLSRSTVDKEATFL